MSRKSMDLTIESALADPMIRAAMKADRVDPGALESMLRAVAGSLRPERRAPRLAAAAMPCLGRMTPCGAGAAW